MSTFEIQLYKSGIWNADSYFDDRELAMSEAEKLSGSAKHAGVRVLQEDFDEKSNKSDCRVVFSKLRQADGNQDWRVEAKRTSMAKAGAAGGRKGGKASKDGSRSSPKKSNASLYIGFVVAFIVLIAGAAAMIGLQEIAKYL